MMLARARIVEWTDSAQFIKCHMILHARTRHLTAALLFYVIVFRPTNLHIERRLFRHLRIVGWLVRFLAGDLTDLNFSVLLASD